MGDQSAEGLATFECLGKGQHPIDGLTGTVNQCCIDANRVDPAMQYPRDIS